MLRLVWLMRCLGLSREVASQMVSIAGTPWLNLLGKAGSPLCKAAPHLSSATFRTFYHVHIPPVLVYL